MNDLFLYTSGPADAEIVLVGEAWGETEANLKVPFCGYSGRELFKMLGEAGFGDPEILKTALKQRSSQDWLKWRSLYLQSSSILLTNVIAERPPDNDFTHFLYPIKETKKNDPTYHGVHARPALHSAIRKLRALITFVKPKLIIAAGNWPLHILTEHASVETQQGFKLPTGITTWRGSQTYCRHEFTGASGNSPADGGALQQKRTSQVASNELIPVLPIIHPAAITRAWYLRSVTVHDLRARAKRFISGACTWTPTPTNSISRPKLVDVERFINQYIFRAELGKVRLCVDIETFSKRFIACVGLGSREQQLCVPFFYFDQAGVNHPYWSSLDEELHVWMRLKTLLEHPNVEIIGQNFMYDSLFLASIGIDCTVTHDTMVKYHLLYPGTPKALHYISSLFCNHYLYWKDESEEWAASALGAEELWAYNCKDIAYTDECNDELDKLIERANMQDALSWRMREWKLARRMALRGIRDDSNLRQIYKSDIAKQRTALRAWLLHAVPEAWRYGGKDTPWYTSPKATMAILYELVGAVPVIHKKTKRPTSDDEAIEELLKRKELFWLEPLLKRLQAMRSLNVFDSHHLDVKLGPGGRYTTQYNITGTETFRWSSNANPLGEGSNAQNLPKVEVDD